MNIVVGVILGLAAVAANLAFLKYWKAVEARESVAGRIPARKLVSGDRRASILYLDDLMSFRIGDRFALSVMDFAIAFTFYTRGFPSVSMVIACVVAGGAWTFVSHALRLFESEPTSSCPDKLRFSRVGVVHVPYHAIQYIAGLTGLAVVYGMVRGEVSWSPMAIVGLFAAGVYFLTTRFKGGLF